uniref:Exocyst complex component EXOC6/Sec15 N-terminal domain-containing protein n=1 Tax=Acanthochromis polyacanthus TaxID=80966 RepID=A0A3Q1F274_9TELE
MADAAVPSSVHPFPFHSFSLHLTLIFLCSIKSCIRMMVIFCQSVYDGQEHGLFMEKLDARIRNHDREIEKMCNHHFQGFVDSITELLKVRGEAQKLKSQVTETNRRLQDDGKDLMSSMEELKQCRVQQRNIATTIDKLTHCLPVLEMYSRLQEQMKARRYYPALRTLEQLEQTCLPRAGQYRFCSIMAENIPKLRTQIRDTAMTQLRDFLESIRKHSDKIGETAIRQVRTLWKNSPTEQVDD